MMGALGPPKKTALLTMLPLSLVPRMALKATEPEITTWRRRLLGRSALSALPPAPAARLTGVVRLVMSQAGDVGVPTLTFTVLPTLTCMRPVLSKMGGQ